MPSSPSASRRAVLPGGGTLWSVHYLRAIAALGVVVFHSFDDTPWQFPIGASGIHLFFTISGFVIGTSSERHPLGPWAFARVRIVRVVPLYWLATLVAVLSTFVMPGFFWQATADPAKVLASLFFIPQIGIAGGNFPVLYQGWTLQYEMYFYALFALCLTLPERSRFLALCGWIGCAIAAGALLQPGGPVLQTYTNPICLEFVGGVLVARNLVRLARGLNPFTAILLAVAGAITFLVADAWEDQLCWLPSLLMPVGTAALVLGLVWLERAGRMPRLPWLRFAGEASYATYLFQTLGAAFVVALLPDLPDVPRIILLVGSAQALGCLVYLGVERPLHRRLKRIVLAPATLPGPGPLPATG